MKHTIILCGVYSTPESFKLGRMLARSKKAAYKFLDTSLNVDHELAFDVSTEYHTMGHLWQELIRKERRGDYLGGTVQMIPHMTALIKEWITEHNSTVTVIGGVVGDMENQVAIEAVRDLKDKGARVIMMAPIIYLRSAGESKTKPVQHASKQLAGMGIRPDALCLDADKSLTLSERKKIAMFTSVSINSIFENITTNQKGLEKLVRLTK